MYFKIRKKVNEFLSILNNLILIIVRLLNLWRPFWVGYELNRHRWHLLIGYRNDARLCQIAHQCGHVPSMATFSYFLSLFLLPELLGFYSLWRIFLACLLAFVRIGLRLCPWKDLHLWLRHIELVDLVVLFRLLGLGFWHLRWLFVLLFIAWRRVILLFDRQLFRWQLVFLQLL